MLRCTALVLFIASASAFTVPQASAQPSLGSALALRGGGAIPAETYLKLVAVPFAGYALQFLLMPAMVTDMHFNYKPDVLHNFLARGTSVSIIGFLYLLFQIPAEQAVKVATVYSFAIGVVYPWYAKFSGMDVKYPMHYVPEVLMLGLTVAGLLAM